jgi:hypothetical protein
MERAHKPPQQSAGYTLVSRGRYALMKLYTESMEGIDNDLCDLGLVGLTQAQLSEITGNKPLFPDPPSKEPTAWEIRWDELAAIAVVLQDPIIKGTSEGVVAKIVEAILPRFRNIFARATKESDIQYPMTISQVFFFTAVQVQITAIAVLKKPSDQEVALKLFPLVFDRGISWLLTNGPKGHYLTYRIIDGNIDPFPTVTELPASFYPPGPYFRPEH